MTVNKKSGHFSSFSSGFRQVLLQSDVELPIHTENSRVERFRHYILLLKMNELFSPNGLTSQVLFFSVS